MTKHLVEKCLNCQLHNYIIWHNLFNITSLFVSALSAFNFSEQQCDQILLFFKDFDTHIVTKVLG